MKLTQLLFVIIFWIAGTAQASEFPLCLYGVNNPNDLKLVKKAGFSCIQSYNQNPENMEKLAKAAQKRGLKGVFSPHKLYNTPYEQKAQQWPVLAWYLVDEPDVHHWSRERVRAAHQQAKETFPRQDTTLVIGQGKTAVPYYDLPDTMMMDWYPVPHHPLTSFGDNVRYTKEGMARMGAATRPMWGVVQIFDWKQFKQHRPDNQRIGRFPTRKEMRFMSYDGILNGATGLFYFIFTHNGDILPRTAPAFWADVRAVVKELARFKVVIEKGTEQENPVAVQAPLRMKTWKYKGALYSVLLNRSDRAEKVPDELLGKKFKALYNTQKTDLIPPYEVWVLNIPRNK